LIFDLQYSVIIWETFIKGGSEGGGTIWSIWVGRWGSGGLNWLSLDHHGNGDVVVVGGVLGFSSGLLSDRLESVITNNLSERLEGNGVNGIEGVGWGNLEGEGSLLIDWYVNFLGLLLEDLSIGETGHGHGSHGVLEVHSGSRSRLNVKESLLDKGLSGLDGSSLDSHSCEGHLCKFVHIYIN
jgi:hypothetical protein